MEINAYINGFDISEEVLKISVGIAKKEKCKLKIMSALKNKDLKRYKRDTSIWRHMDGSIICGRDARTYEEMILYKKEREIYYLLKQFDVDETEYEICSVKGKPYYAIAHDLSEEENNILAVSVKDIWDIKKLFKRDLMRKKKMFTIMVIYF
jgi:hypothetical protein